MQNQNLKIENLVECFDTAKLTDFLLELYILNSNQKKKNLLNLVMHIQGFFGLKCGGIICVANVNE